MAKTKGLGATLESMTNATATTETPTVVATGMDDWDSLPSATVAVYTRQTPAKDFEALTPAVIKARVSEGFEATAKAGKPVWFTQECGTPARAAEFLKLARQYARFRDMTLRGKAVEGSSELRYTVKNREVRKSAKSS